MLNARKKEFHEKKNDQMKKNQATSNKIQRKIYYEKSVYHNIVIFAFHSNKYNPNISRADDM